MGSEQRKALQSTLLDEINKEGGSYETLALQLFEFQFSQNLPYRAYCQALARSPGTVSHWTEIPSVPTEVFKADLHLACFPPEEISRTFLTSGTSGESQGRHHFRDLELYEASIKGCWSRAHLPTLNNSFFAALPPSSTQSSSLSHMFEVLCPDGDPQRWLTNEDHQIDPTSLRALRDTPIILFGSTLSLLHLCDTSQPLPLPSGSHVFQTGGFKGVTGQHDPEKSTERIRKHFGISADHLIHEYGMTELSSQCYSLGLNTPFICPPWMRIQVIDPATNQPLPPGGTGYLVLYDLANLDSVLAIRTRDFAQSIDHSSFHLLGRDPAALPRGCSRASDEFFQASS